MVTAPARRSAALLFAAAVVAGCPAPVNSPRPPGQARIEPRTQEVGRPGSQLAGVASDGSSVFAALTAAPGASAVSGEATASVSAPTTTIEALQTGSLGEPPRWQIELIGRGGPLVASAGQV